MWLKLMLMAALLCVDGSEERKVQVGWNLLSLTGAGVYHEWEDRSQSNSYKLYKARFIQYLEGGAVDIYIEYPRINIDGEEIQHTINGAFHKTAVRKSDTRWRAEHTKRRLRYEIKYASNDMVSVLFTGYSVDSGVKTELIRAVNIDLKTGKAIPWQQMDKGWVADRLKRGEFAIIPEELDSEQLRREFQEDFSPTSKRKHETDYYITGKKIGLIRNLTAGSPEGRCAIAEIDGTVS